MQRVLSDEFPLLEMRRPKRLVLVRHAKSLRNEAKKDSVYFADEYARSKVKGIPDHEIALTHDGFHDQAIPTGIGLREDYGVPDYMYDSGFRRTVQTGQAIRRAYTPAERRRIKIRHNPFISERHPGYTYDMTKQEAEHHFPFMPDYWKTFGGFFASPIGGESLFAVTTRVYLFLNMLFRDRVGQNVFVVTHGGTLRCFRFLLEHWDYKRALKWPKGESPKNCGVTVYEFDPDAQRLVLKKYNKIYGS